MRATICSLSPVLTYPTTPSCENEASAREGGEKLESEEVRGSKYNQHIFVNVNNKDCGVHTAVLTSSPIAQAGRC
jgi:hypothetical protein